MIDPPAFLCHNCSSPLSRITNVPPSPIPHLLWTNKVPSDAEAQDIEASIVAVCQDISQLDTDITHAQRVLDRLTREREALKIYVQDHAVFISAVRRVPAEIWSEIFLHCLPSSVELPESMEVIPSRLLVFNPRNAPALLLRVCRDWTDIALSSPRLWSWIGLFSRKGYQPTAAIVQTWLRRSQQVPLSVILEPFHQPLDGMSSFFQSPAVQSVLEQSHRWRAVNMRLPLFLLPMFSALDNHLPELEDLHLNFYTQPQDTRGLDLFHNTPKLRRITIYNHPPFPIFLIKFPWSQLTHFSAQYKQSTVVLCAVLLLAPNLVTVDWQLGPSPDNLPSLTRPMQHLHLRDLSIAIVHDALDSPLDCHISLPSLRTFSISAAGQFWRLPNFETFASRNCHTLESFEMNTWVIEKSQLIDCMKSLQSVSHVTLSMSISDDVSGRRHNVSIAVEELLVALCCTTVQRGPVLLPRLKTIKIQCYAPDRCRIGSKFVTMVESRWRIPAPPPPDGLDLACQSNTVSRIDTASLKLGCSLNFTMDPADLRRLQTLTDEGLNVRASLSYKYPFS
jgi:hypothetical protein